MKQGFKIEFNEETKKYTAIMSRGERYVNTSLEDIILMVNLHLQYPDYYTFKV